jgi:hypothetical protein
MRAALAWTTMMFSLCATTSGSALAQISQSTRDLAADWIYSDCSEKTLSTPNKDAFCRCLGDYLMDLLTDDEIRYVATYLRPTQDMQDKERRAQATCTAFTQ